MPQYLYLGLNQSGQKVNGTAYAKNSKDLKSILIKQGIFLLQITNTTKSYRFFNSKIKSKHINNIIEHLAILINSNVQLSKAFSVIIQEEQNQAVKNLVTSCKNSVDAGKTLTQTLQEYPQHFSNLICGLVDVGEQSGNLDIMLHEIVNYIKKSELQKRKVIKALIYPLSILVTTVIVTVILLIFVVPQFKSMFDNFGAELPIYTQFIISVSNFLKRSWMTLAAIIITNVTCFKFFHKRSLVFAKWLDKLILKTFLVKNIVTYSTIARLSKALAITLKSGIPLLPAMNISLTTITNWQYKLALQRITQEVSNGKSLSVAIEKQNLFPSRVVQMISIGEETGMLDSMLEKIATTYDNDLNNISDIINTSLEPLIMAILGLIVGGLVIGMYLPIFRLGTVI